jgi:AcrR family transcriptional regulator
VIMAKQNGTDRAKKAAPPGRPRSVAVGQAVLRAAFTLFIERGLSGATIEQIAAHAGVAKTSIYRRWASRDALLAEAIEAARNELAPGYSLEVVEGASPTHFIQLLLGVGELMRRPEVRRLVARLVGTIPDNPDLVRVYRETYFAPRRRALLTALRRAQAEGVLSPEADVEVIADMLAGALLHRLLFEFASDEPVEDVAAYVARLVKELGIDLAALGLPPPARSTSESRKRRTRPRTHGGKAPG